jgi:hypothetical protein
LNDPFHGLSFLAVPEKAHQTFPRVRFAGSLKRSRRSRPGALNWISIGRPIE